MNPVYDDLTRTEPTSLPNTCGISRDDGVNREQTRRIPSAQHYTLVALDRQHADSMALDDS
ncbi:MAG: hypothetical protein K8T89_19590 [Planctomycetes bacterium]|nr:hypothetical protein [Planctomycetota bacterium]